jgi:molybdate transport system regulatory protein
MPELIGTDLQRRKQRKIVHASPEKCLSIRICNRFVLFAKGFDGNLASRSGEPVSMPKSSALPSLSVRIDLDARGRIGPGKIQLLEKINACGSISAAGRAMDMSYKRAWDLVDEINRICGHAAVARQTGGKNGGGAILTPFGISLVARYRKIERAAASAVRKELIALRTDIGRPKKSSRA